MITECCVGGTHFRDAARMRKPGGISSQKPEIGSIKHPTVAVVSKIHPRNEGRGNCFACAQKQSNPAVKMDGVAIINQKASSRSK